MWIREESTGTVSGSDERRVAWRAHVSIYKSVVECTIIQCSKFTSWSSAEDPTYRFHHALLELGNDHR